MIVSKQVSQTYLLHFYSQKKKLGVNLLWFSVAIHFTFSIYWENKEFETKKYAGGQDINSLWGQKMTKKNVHGLVVEDLVGKEEPVVKHDL